MPSGICSKSILAISVREDQLDYLVQLWGALGGGWNEETLTASPTRAGRKDS